MNDKIAIALIEAYAINAEIEGMKAENSDRIVNNWAVAYPQSYFDEKASELRNLISQIKQS